VLKELFKLRNLPGFAARQHLIDTASLISHDSSASIFRDALNMNQDSAAGRRAGKVPILLLKTKSTPYDGYEGSFSVVKGTGEKWSYEPAFVPVLEHRFQEEALGTLRRILEEREISNIAGARYGGLIFTSQRAIEAFASVVKEGMSF
jgi:hypothetical protein